MTIFGEDQISAALNDEPLFLSLAALEWLQERGKISALRNSPLASVLSPELKTAAEERSVAGSLLFGRGLVTKDLRSTEQSIQLEERFREAIETLARPEIGVRLSVSVPGQRPLSALLFIAGETATFGSCDRLLFCVGPAMKKAVLVASLAQNLRNGSECVDPRPVRMLPFQLRSSTLIWKKSNRKVSESVPRELATKALVQGGASPQDAAIAIEGLFRTGFVQRSASTLVLQSEYCNGLELLWSDHQFVIDRVLFDHATTRLTVNRLLFVGPPGKRMLCRWVSLPLNARSRADRLKAHPNEALLLAPVRADSSEHLILRFLSTSDPMIPSPGDFPDGRPATKPDARIVRTCNSCGAPAGNRKFCTKCGKRVE